jgi:hypothetical protein
MENRYQVRTKHGVIYKHVTSWKVWELDENFIEFIQSCRDGKAKLILPKSQIESIET